MNKFKSLGLKEELLHTLEKLHFSEPTIIQVRTIPPILEGKDVIAQSATGSGKTLAFGLGILQRMVKGKGIQALIMTPTRELASQVGLVIQQLSSHNPANVAIVYGGVGINPQIDDLTRAEIVVGTPGRILDHLERRTMNLGHVSFLVLDEADRMLDMGFIDDVERIIKACPKHRQTMLFSATIPPEVKKLSGRYMTDPMQVFGQQQVEPEKLEEVYYDVEDRMKISLLIHLLREEEQGLVMVFCRTRRTADFVGNNLKLNEIRSNVIHGGFTQAKRESILEMFHAAKVLVLVCTDVAARGLDIKDVSHVYNYDIPQDSKDYVHRIGRTARAGKEGKIINLLSGKDHDNFQRILSDSRRAITKIKTPYVERVRVQSPEERPEVSYGPSGGRRFSRGGRPPSRHRSPRR